jgi:hypothetical protein
MAIHWELHWRQICMQPMAPEFFAFTHSFILLLEAGAV